MTDDEARESPIAAAAESVVPLARGAWVTMTLRAAVRLGVFDALQEPRPLDELADLTGSRPELLARLLRVLTDLGLVTSGAAGIAATPAGLCLAEGHPSRSRDLLLLQSWLPNLASWHDLDETLRTGGSAYERVHGMPSWEQLSAHPEMLRVFNGAMSRRWVGQVEAILAAVDLDGVRLVVDVGGGRGAMLAGLLQERPEVSGMVAERPDVAVEADEFLAASGLAGRAHGAAADFFEGVPSGGDLYTLANVLHDWDDDDCIAILRTVRRAMAGDARLVVVEKVMGVPGRTPAEERDLHLVDLHMLVMFGARERTREEYDSLLVAAGFRPGRVPDTGTEWNVIETRPAG